VLTIHHSRDWRRGLSEMRRAAKPQVILFFEPAVINRLWAMEGGVLGRPEAYLDPQIQQGVSWLAQLSRDPSSRSRPPSRRPGIRGMGPA
jgi:hypothetical protein